MLTRKTLAIDCYQQLTETNKRITTKKEKKLQEQKWFVVMCLLTINNNLSIYGNWGYWRIRLTTLRRKFQSNNIF